MDGNASAAGSESGPSNRRTASGSRERDEARYEGVDVAAVDSDSDDDDGACAIALFHVLRDDQANSFTW